MVHRFGVYAYAYVRIGAMMGMGVYAPFEKISKHLSTVVISLDRLECSHGSPLDTNLMQTTPVVSLRGGNTVT